MRCKSFTRLIVISALLLFVGVARADFESEVIDLVNAEREACNCDLHPLRYNQELTVAARRHSKDMGDRNYFSHTTPKPEEIKFNERITDAGYNYQKCGENIAAGLATPEAVVDGWMNSEGHRKNILDSDYCDIGVGYAAVNGSDFYHYWTQDFGRRAGVTQCPEPVAAPPATETPVLSDTSDTGGGGDGGGCFIGVSSTSGRIGALVKSFFDSQNWRDAVDAAEELDRSREEGLGIPSSSELYRSLNPPEKRTPQSCH
jgi:hypothetical protein